MNALPIIIGALCVIAISYRYYSAFIAAKVLALDDSRPVPSQTMYDGHNYYPTNKWVLFGHHFAAISGAGPLIGPVLAAQFGFLPGLLWLVIGVCLGGAVHDHLERQAERLQADQRGERQPAGQAVAGRRARDDDAESENGSEEPHQRRRTQIPTLQHAGPGGQQDEADPAQDSGHEPVAERCRGLTAVAAREGCLWNRGVHPDQDCGRDQDEAGAGHIHLHGERLLTASRQRRPGGPGRFAPHVGDARRRERQ